MGIKLNLNAISILYQILYTRTKQRNEKQRGIISSIKHSQKLRQAAYSMGKAYETAT
jgi:hypothetical protein